MASTASRQPLLWAVTLEVRQRIVLTWTYNAYGVEREHLGVGYRLRVRGEDEPWGRSNFLP